jgi:predicted amidohydrolase YtcJ
MSLLAAAFAGFEEDEKGSLAPGKLGDFVVLSGDPLSIPPQQLDRIRAEATVVGGRVVYPR